MSEQSSIHVETDPLSPGPTEPAGAGDSSLTAKPPASDDSQSSVEHESAHDSANIPAPDQQTVISKKSPVGPGVGSRSPSPLEMGVTLEGENLGHFRLEKFVGGGGMGAVFRATDTMLDRIVAVKVLSCDQSDDEIRRRFRNEAQSAARLDHDNIARVHYVGEDQGWNYIVFEFIEGLNIRDLVYQQGPLPLEQAINFTLQVAEALEHAFHRDVVHRDIKPSNVLITPDGNVKLVDMGLARLHQVESGDGDLTASGVTLGTFDYISPEQARDPRSADVRSDLYSLGCTLYFMLTGQPPFPDGTVLQKLLSHTSDERPDPRLFRPELPEEVTNILARMLSKHPEERYQQPSALIGELLLLADQLGLHGATKGGTVWITPSERRLGFLERLIPILVGAAGLVAAVLLLDFYLSYGEKTSTGDAGSRATAPDVTGNENDDRSAADSQANDQPRSDQNTSEHPADLPSSNGDSNASPEERPAVGPVPEADSSDAKIEVATNTPNPLGELTQNMQPVDGVEPTFNKGGELAVADETSASLAVGMDAGASLGPGDLSSQDTVVVDPDGTEAPNGYLLAKNIKQAIRFAINSREISKIELRFDGPLEVDPMEIALSSFKNDLTISAGEREPGSYFSPQLVFRPSHDSEEKLLSIVGEGEMTWERVHFHVELPNDSSPDWSLFHLNAVRQLKLQNCTMTIVNFDQGSGGAHDKVSFFSIQPPKEEVAVLKPVIVLEYCIARGQATLVRVDQVTPLTLTWTQGLFVSSKVMLETGGAMMEPPSGSIQINLTNVTAIMYEGMCRIETETDRRRHLLLEINCRNSILRPSGHQIPLVEHIGVDEKEKAEGLLKFDAKFTYLPAPGDGLIWRRGTEKYSNDGSLKEDWFKSDSSNKPITTDLWQRTLPGGFDVHLQEERQFLTNTDINTMGQSFAGFDEGSLPTPPRRPRPLDATDAP